MRNCALPCASDVEQSNRNAAEEIWRLADSNYQVQFTPDQDLSERIIFPTSPSQANGIEDARFVCFRMKMAATCTTLPSPPMTAGS